jgi:uncharacterized protein YggE
MPVDESSNLPRADHISVIGDAAIDVVPDLVAISFSIERVGESMAMAKSDVDERCAKVIKLARETGIDQIDVTASQLSLGPHREYRNNEWQDRGFKAQRSVTIRLREILNPS